MGNSLSQIEQILDCTTDGVVTVNRDWKFSYLNARAREFISKGREMLGRDLWVEFPDTEDGSILYEYKRTMVDRVPTKFVEYFATSFGIWFEVHAYPVEGGMAIFLRDITEKRKREEALRLCEQAMQAVPLGISIASYSPETDYPVVYVNPAFEKLTGFSAAEAIGRNCRFLQGSDTDQSARSELHRALREERSATVILRNYTKSGKLFQNELLMSPMRNRKGKITHYVGIQMDITELHEVRERLARQALYDALTGLANRYLFMDRLESGVKNAERSKGKLAVVYLDVDNFKHVNDSLGHTEADYLLTHVARRLTDSVRAVDTVARLGGDEFALLLMSWVDRGDLEKLMDRILASIASKLHLGGEELMVTASAGVAVFPEDASDAEDLLRMADQAMYAAKRERKNSWQEYRIELQAGFKQPLNLTSELRRALDGNQFVLHYQPRINTLTGRIGGVEALIRWNHPTRGLIMPGQFIRVAEDTGLIINIGRWVIGEALRQAAIWASFEPNAVQISLNVSPAQFRDGGFVEGVRLALGITGIAAELIELELTESLMMDCAETADTAMVKLKDMGVRLAIDDFGAGYAGLNYLARFSIDTIKIDRSFTNRIHESKTAAAVCRSILHLGQELGLNTVAEGIETKAQAIMLQRWQCDEMQGFYFGKPVSAEEMSLLLDKDGPVTAGLRLPLGFNR